MSDSTEPYDLIPFATSVTGVATVQVFAGSASTVPADFTLEVIGITYSAAVAGTVVVQSSGPFGTVSVDNVVVGTSPFARGYSRPATAIFTIRGNSQLVVTVTGTVAIAGIARLKQGRQ